MKITADTNVLVRAIVEDDAKQSKAARKALESADVVAIAAPALCELVWVLAQGYRIDAASIAAAIRGLIDSANVVVNRPAAEAGLALLEAGGDFADGVIAFEGGWLGAETFVSFDKKAVKLLESQGAAARLLGGLEVSKIVESETAKAVEYSQRLMDVAINIVAASNIELTKDFARDPKIVALTILCRTISNFRAALLLAEQEAALEARVLVRLIYENLLWVGALRERGSAFVRDMIDDDVFNRKSLAHLTLKKNAEHGADVASADALKLRTLIKEISKQFPSNKKKLHAGKTANEGVVDLAYVMYSSFSLDAVHCSVTALGRHLSSERTAQKTELEVAVVPRVSPQETFSTVLHACRGLMGVATGANEILGFTSVTGELAALLKEFEGNGWSEGDRAPSQK